MAAETAPLGDSKIAPELEEQTRRLARHQRGDEWQKVIIQLTPATEINNFVGNETVSQSEAGFELVHQAVCMMPHWLIQGDCEGKWSVQMQIRVTTNVHSFNVCQASHSFSQVYGVNQGV